MQNSNKSKFPIWHAVAQSFSSEKWQARLAVVPKECCYVWDPIHNDRSGMTFRPTRHYWSIWACQHWRVEARGIFGEKRGRVMWRDSQPGTDTAVGDGWRRWRLWGTHRGQAVLVVIKEAPIKCCSGPWLHCQAVRARMHGGGDAEGHLTDKRWFFSLRTSPEWGQSNSLRKMCDLSADNNSYKWQISKQDLR